MRLAGHPSILVLSVAGGGGMAGVKRCRERNLTYEPPAEWSDSGVCLFQPPLPRPGGGAAGPNGPSIRVAWQPYDGSPFQTFGARRFVDLGRIGDVAPTVERSIGGRDVLLLHATVDEAQTPYEMRVALFDPGSASATEALVVELTTLTDPLERLRCVFDAVIETVRFHQDLPVEPDTSLGRASARPPSAEAMARTQLRSASFEPPSDWNDLSVGAYLGPPPPATPGAEAVPTTAPASPTPPRRPTLMVTRELLRAGTSLRAFVDRRIFDIGRGAEGCEILESSETSVAGRPAMRLRFRFTADGARMEQTTVFVDPLQDPAHKVTLFTLTCPLERNAAMRPALDALLASVHFDGPLARNPVPASR